MNFWASLLGILNASCSWMSNIASRFGEFPIIISLNRFSKSLIWAFVSSSVPKVNIFVPETHIFIYSFLFFYCVVGVLVSDPLSSSLRIPFPIRSVCDTLHKPLFDFFSLPRFPWFFFKRTSSLDFSLTSFIIAIQLFSVFSCNSCLLESNPLSCLFGVSSTSR